MTAPDTDQTSPQPVREFKDIRATGAPLILSANEGTLLHLPGKAKTLFVGNSDIADVQVTDERAQPEVIFLIAKKSGTTVIYAADAAGNILLARNVRVDGPVTIIRRGAIEFGGEPSQVPTSLTIPVVTTSTPGSAPTATVAPASASAAATR